MMSEFYHIPPSEVFDKLTRAEIEFTCLMLERRNKEMERGVR